MGETSYLKYLPVTLDKDKTFNDKLVSEKQIIPPPPKKTKNKTKTNKQWKQGQTFGEK